jgi:hypothetical protein
MPNPNELIDDLIAKTPDWRGRIFTTLRKIIHDADPEIIEEWKWGTAVNTNQGLVLAAGPFEGTVKMNFFQCACLPDPQKLFNAGPEAKKTRAIDFREGDKISEPALKALIRAAVAHNRA